MKHIKLLCLVFAITLSTSAQTFFPLEKSNNYDFVHDIYSYNDILVYVKDHLDIFLLGDTNQIKAVDSCQMEIVFWDRKTLNKKRLLIKSDLDSIMLNATSNIIYNPQNKNYYLFGMMAEIQNYTGNLTNYELSIIRVDSAVSSIYYYPIQRLKPGFRYTGSSKLILYDSLLFCISTDSSPATNAYLVKINLNTGLVVDSLKLLGWATFGCRPVQIGKINDSMLIVQSDINQVVNAKNFTIIDTAEKYLVNTSAAMSITNSYYCSIDSSFYYSFYNSPDYIICKHGYDGALRTIVTLSCSDSISLPTQYNFISGNPKAFKFTYPEHAYSCLMVYPTYTIAALVKTNLVTKITNWAKAIHGPNGKAIEQISILHCFDDSSALVAVWVNENGDYNTYYFVVDKNGNQSEMWPLLDHELKKNTIDQFLIYPNPASNSIQVKGAHDGSMYKIYNAKGQEVISGVYDGKNIYIGCLKQGLHYVLTDNGNSSVRLAFLKI